MTIGFNLILSVKELAMAGWMLKNRWKATLKGGNHYAQALAIEIVRC
jgi:hypothetical protein